MMTSWAKLSFIRRFVLQLISLAGLHLNAVTTGTSIFAPYPAYLLISCVAELARAFKTDGMLAYVNLIQKKEKEIGCDVLTHQKWYAIISECSTLLLGLTDSLPCRSGANYIDRILTTVSAGSSSTSAVGKDSTEHSF